MATPAYSSIYNVKSKTPTGFVEYNAPEDGPVFNNYKNYVVAVGKDSKASSSYNAQSSTSSGFLEFKPRDMSTQSKYDAMSPVWEGVDSTEKAVARGDYSLDSAERTRSDLRKPVPKLTFNNVAPAKPASILDNCVVQ
jgi:hypothetical protein